MEGIATYLVCGFLEAGKTTYIQDCVFHGFFHKRGSTLILCFEAGEVDYDVDRLRQYRTDVAFFEGGEAITAFCRGAIERYRPDRIYVEMNGMRAGLREQLPEEMKVVFSAMLIDGGTLALYAKNMRQLLQDMVAASNQVTFNRCPDKASLEPYGQLFRLMNRGAVYLWEGPGGYHEKAFEVFVPFDLNQAEIELREADFIPFALDAAAHPEHYDGKLLTLTAQMAPCDGEEGVRAGRTVMTCCMADLQFMGLPCAGIDGEAHPSGSWIRLTARAETTADRYGRPRLTLRALSADSVKPPESGILRG
ncbi:MAG: hypothetical protein IJ769_09185 [Clostridia bacterium]|nr:hypothetical protein [Clostridia bacterium]